MTLGRKAAIARGLVIRIDTALLVASAVAIISSVAAVPGAAGVLGAGLALTMLAIAATDARRFIIPDPLNAAGLALGFSHAAWASEGETLAAAVGGAALRAALVALSFFVLRALYARYRGREGIGLGDVKLAAVAGAWLDWPVIPIAIEIAALSALAAYAVRRYICRRPLRATSALPFGLFFAPAIWFGWLLEATVLQSL